MTFWLATTNRHKIKEIWSFFKNQKSISFKSLKDLSSYIPPEETGSSFLENAEIKANHLLSVLKASSFSLETNTWILGEDSGLEVQALKGEPGIYSARYAGLNADDKKNNQLLLQNLKNQKERQAQYVCAIVCLSADKQKHSFQGFCSGSLAFAERGQNGFGYDPLFIPTGQSQTLGELPAEFKEKISHRTLALKQLKQALSP